MYLRLRSLYLAYPRQFWLLFFGLLISTIGASMIWPFLMIYVSEQLSLPLATVAVLMTVNSVAGLMSSFVAGPIIDKAGRKWVMAVSLIANGLAYLWLSQAHTLPEFAIVMGVSGAVNPLYRVGADAMMADLIAPARRADAYSLLRTGHNAGVALGPAIGGFIAVTSYTNAFYCAAAGLAIYGLMITFLAAETLPRAEGAAQPARQPFGGYSRVLGDRQFMSLILALTLTMISASMVWVLMGVYAKSNFGVLESQYGFIPTANALMVVFFQYSVTQVSKRYPALQMLMLGSLLYSVAVFSVAWATGFGGFLISMIILTIGELILSPTATTLAANLAPAHMRGRYMSLYGLTWGAASGIGPVVGGLLNDHMGPVAIWYGGGLIAAAGALYFLILSRRYASEAAPLIG